MIPAFTLKTTQTQDICFYLRILSHIPEKVERGHFHPRKEVKEQIRYDSHSSSSPFSLKLDHKVHNFMKESLDLRFYNKNLPLCNNVTKDLRT